MFSGIYFLMTIATLIMALLKVNYFVMLFMVVAQFLSFIWSVISYVPGGTNGISTASRIAVSSLVSRF